MYLNPLTKIRQHAGCVAASLLAALCGVAQAVPEVSLLESDPIATEGAPTDPARITLVRSGPTDSSLTVHLRIGGSASPGSDYLPIPSPITLAAGQMTREIVIFPYEGTLAEGYETIEIAVASGDGYTVAAPDRAIVTLCDSAYEAWKLRQFPSVQLSDPEVSGPAADPDDDGCPNLGEFFAQSDPRTPDLGLVAGLENRGGRLHLSLLRNPSAYGLAVEIEASSGLAGWKALDPQPPMTVDFVEGRDLLLFPLPYPEPGSDRPYWRARLTQPAAPSAGGFDYYVDAHQGSDSHNGTSPATAFATLTKALAVTSGNRAASIGLARGQRHPPAATMTFNISGRWGAYGEGHLPFIDGSLPVEAAITPHPVHANVYVAEITHAVQPFYNTTNSSSNGPHVGLWWETPDTGILGQYLEPVFESADTAAAEQFVKDHPGRCFVQKVGSSLTDVRLETSGSTLRYTFQLADGGDPRRGGSLRYACYHSSMLQFTPGAVISSIAFGRNTRKDCISNNNRVNLSPTIPLPTYIGCAWLDPGCHASVGPVNWIRCVAFSRTRSRTNGAGAWHCYSGVFDPRIPVCEDSTISGFSNAVYSHGSNESDPVLQSMQAQRLVIENGLTCFALPPCAQAPVFEDIRASNVNRIFSGFGILSRFAVDLDDNANLRRVSIFAGRSAGTVQDGVVRFSYPGAYITDYAPEPSNAEAIGTPVVKRVTIVPNTARAGLTTGTQRFISYQFEDVAGVRTLSTTDPQSPNLLLKATMRNSYIGPTRGDEGPLFATLADYQAKVPGAGNDLVMFDPTKPLTFAGDPLVNPTLTGPAEILGKGMGVDPEIILDLPRKLARVPSVQSLGFTP